MSYWKAKKDLEFMRQYRETIGEFLAAQKEIDSVVKQSSYPGYMMRQDEGMRIMKATEATRNRMMELRKQVAKDTSRASRIAVKNGVAIIMTSYPAPAVGGPVIRFNLFEAILHDPSHGAMIGEGVKPLQIFDKINAAISKCEERVETEWNHLINPFYWIKALCIFILRLPVKLIELAGFNVEKFEEHFWGKFFQLIWMLIVIGVLLALGIGRGDLIELIRKIITKS